MAKQAKQNEIINKDDSTYTEKYDSLIRARIAKKTRNTLKQKILTLANDHEYLRLLLKPKYRYATRTEENKFWGQKVLTDYFKDNESNLYVQQSNYSLEQHCALAGKKIKNYPDLSVALYVAINDNTRQENGKNNEKITTSESILLSRFDPGQKYEHINRIDEDSLKFKYFKKSIKPAEAHFHFASRTQALAYNDTAECDAISLDDLIRYVFELKNIKRSSQLFYDDLSMPYLAIKFDPKLYHTSSKMLKLGDAIPRNHLVKKSFVFGTIDNRADIFGLDAVLFDLILLRGMVRLSSEPNSHACHFVDSASLIYQTTITLASKIAAAGLCESYNNDLEKLANKMMELNLNRQREL